MKNVSCRDLFGLLDFLDLLDSEHACCCVLVLATITWMDVAYALEVECFVVLLEVVGEEKRGRRSWVSMQGMCGLDYVCCCVEHMEACKEKCMQSYNARVYANI